MENWKVNWTALQELLNETTFLSLIIGFGLLAFALGGYHDLAAGLATSAAVLFLSMALFRHHDSMRLRSAPPRQSRP